MRVRPARPRRRRGALHAQAPTKRLPVIVGNGLVNILVEVDGSVKTWGNPGAMDPSVSLGDGVKPSATREVKSPRVLPGVTGVASASVGVSHALLLKRDGTILAWGDNDSCQLGNGTDKATNAPLPVVGIRSATEVATGEGVSAAAALRRNGVGVGRCQRGCSETGWRKSIGARRCR